MAFNLADRVRETSSTTGTGDLSLLGAVFGFQAFGDVLADGDETLYAIIQGDDWEGGYGRYNESADALVRETVLGSSNAGALVNFGVGLKQVEIGLPAVIIESMLVGHAGSSRPTWLQPNTRWIDTSVTPPLERAYRRATVTFSIASPSVASITAHGLMPGQPFKVTTTGVLPTGITAGTTYYVVASSYGANSFQFAASIGGTPINASGSQSGIHSLHADVPLGRLVAGGLSGMVGETKEWNADTPLPACGTWQWEDGTNILRADYPDYFAIVGTTHGAGNGTTTVGTPDSRGRVAANQDGSANRLVSGLTGGVDGDTVGAVGGEDRHTPTLAEMIQHNHGITEGSGHRHNNAFAGIPNPNLYNTGVVNTALGPTTQFTEFATTGLTINNNGSSSAANNVQPTIIKKKIIKLKW